MHDKLFTSFGVIGHQHGKCLFLLLFGKGRGQRFRAVYVKNTVRQSEQPACPLSEFQYYLFRVKHFHQAFLILKF